jgi:excisionase family DNA binding protein
VVTTKQAAERLGITPGTVVQLIRRGLLTAERFGRDYCLTEQEIDRYQRERRPAHRPAPAVKEV